MKQPFERLRSIALCAVMAAAAAFIVPADAGAFPHFARQVGRDCNYCHGAVPRLNDNGKTFLFNGYRFEAEGEWRTVKDLSNLPVSFEAEVEGIYDDIKTAGAGNTASDLKVEEAEVIAGGAFGGSGRVSALLSIAVQQTGDTFDTVLPKAFVQINDLAGPNGAGQLNLKAGIGEVGLPFLTPVSTPVTNAMLAETLVGALGSDERFIEVNGAFVNEGDRTVAHRYRAGVARDDVNGDNALKGLFATWAATLDEKYTVGAIMRSGKEAFGAIDVSYLRYGLAAEAEAGPVVLTAGYFKTDRDGALDRDDWLVEALYLVRKFTFGARYETLGETGSRRVRSHTLMGRYDILSSAFAQFEYRHRQDPDRVAGGGETEDKARVILVMLF